jgi:hypothetical protein
MKIYIPTLNRPGRQKTADMLRAASIDYTLIVSDADPNLYRAPFTLCPEWGIRATRQWILNTSDDPKVVMMDDDLRFYYRSTNGARFFAAEPNHVGLMVKALEMMLENYAHGGVCAKFMSNAHPRNYALNSKYYHILAYNRELFPVPVPQYRCEVGEDHDMNLQLLMAGKPNFVLSEWANDDKEHALGGCDTWRTLQMELDNGRMLAEYFPDIVRVVGRRVHIKWKEAAKIGGCL